MNLTLAILAVFAITLTVTKSKLFECKRQFVIERYQSAWVASQKPGYLHYWWHAMWTCPMCLGFWVSAVVCLFVPIYWYPIDVLVVYGGNWLAHCLEVALFFVGRFFEKLSQEMFDKPGSDV